MILILYKHCICGKLIEYSSGKCTSCKDKAAADYKSRKKMYRDSRNKDKEMQFYNTKEWLKLRDYITNSYLNMSIYSYCKDGRIATGEVVHHLVEIRDSWDDRLNKFNLIPVTRREHQEIHNRMEREGKKKIQKELAAMLESFRKEFKIEI